MKKIFYLSTFLVSSLLIAQLQLEHTFQSNQGVKVFNDGESIYYFLSDYNNNSYRNTISIYNSEYSLLKVVNFPWDFTYDSGISFVGKYGISKYIFNTDEKFEFIVYTYNNTTQEQIQLIINEDGEIIMDISSYRNINDIYHDPIDQINKIRLVKNNGSASGVSEVYILPTSDLSNKEIQRDNNSLIAYPIPVNKILNVINPKNGSSQIKIFDSTGRVLLNKNFNIASDIFSINVETFPKGTYFYKIGNLNSKFIKN